MMPTLQPSASDSTRPGSRRKTVSPESEYLYANVPAKIAEELSWALSVGKFFAEHIKAHPELYPFTKIEPKLAAEA